MQSLPGVPVLLTQNLESLRNRLRFLLSLPRGSHFVFVNYCIDNHCLLCQLLVHKVNGIPPCGNILDKAVLWKFQQTLPLCQGTHGHSAVLEMTNDLSGSNC